MRSAGGRSSGSFLDRLTRAPRAPDAASVVRNLEHVFNTRKGCGSVIAEFGLGDYEAASNTSDAVHALIEEMAALVRRYEPRLAGPEVVLLGRHGYSLVRFELAGWMGDERRHFHVEIDTTYRRVEVWEADG